MQKTIIKYLCCKKKEDIKKDKLSEMPYLIITEICSFLEIKEINKLNHANTELNEKTNINYI